MKKYTKPEIAEVVLSSVCQNIVVASPAACAYVYEEEDDSASDATNSLSGSYRSTLWGNNE